ncbi:MULTISPECIES: type IVB secretion system protein IcmN/DotK [Legionella]|uniref:Protein LphA n=1 Tax=Legionella septentrionalis TaxID=2498109 RepID=A0A433JJ72_9GAMM|nr:protein LphA [Legionella septentrionalis]RUR02502.1 protein LphA [Legionella septentrionalis]RUR10386.1 protein LphA [Legionella septentrionalis]RUR17180.1 protein LphA [Legionella septentrionalis]
MLAFVLLSSCWNRREPPLSTSPVLPYKVAGAADAAIMAMQKQFNKAGIQVISLGQDYLISIPSSALFANHSPRLLWEGHGLLNDVACYLKQFRKISVNVTAYSNKCGSPQRERALTLARARAVGDYLWSQNIDSRFIFTHGLGSDKPIVGFDQGGDQSPNSRIEITFRDAVA